MSPIFAPSFWACLTLEFMNTVQRVPRSTGDPAYSASFTKSASGMFRDSAKFSIKEPHPAEQASLRLILSMTPLRMRMHLMSWPPMSRMNETRGSKKAAAVKCATVSTSSMSRRNAAVSRALP